MAGKSQPQESEAADCVVSPLMKQTPMRTGAQCSVSFILSPGPRVHRIVVPTFRMSFTAQLTLPRNTRLDATTGSFSWLFYT